MEKREEFDGQSAFLAFIIVIILHNTFAPKGIRQELNEYSIKFYVIAIVLGLTFFVARDAMKKRRRKKDQEALEQWQKRNREMVEKYRKDKRED